MHFAPSARLLSALLCGGALAMGFARAQVPAAEAGAHEIVLPEDIPLHGDLPAQRQLDRVMLAAVDRYPELVSGPRREGIYRLDVALNADGSIYRSGLKFYEGRFAGDSVLSDSATHRFIPADSGKTWIGMRVERGERAGRGIAANPVMVVFGVLPAGYDDSRSPWRIERAVRARPPDFAGRAPAGYINLLIVLMTEDGRIAREHLRQVEIGKTREPDFSVLGLATSEIGRSGRVALEPDPPDPLVPARLLAPASQGIFDPPAATDEGRDLLVWYAWPRRAGEPEEGARQAPAPPGPGHPAAASTLVERHCPQTLVPESEAADLCWIVLSHEGKFVRAGVHKLDATRRRPFSVMQTLNPDLRVREIRDARVDNTAGDRVAWVMFAWLEEPVP